MLSTSPDQTGSRTGIFGSSPSLVLPASDDPALPVVGTVWRAKYEITELLLDAADVRVWRGRTVEGAHDVELRLSRYLEPEIRAQAWAKVGGIDSPHLQHARDVQRVGDHRIEIAGAVRGKTLLQWRADRPSLDPDTIKAIVSQLADALGALHAFELVHLGLRPEAVFVEETGVSVHCMIGGLEALTSFDRSHPIPAAVNPFYAPPEAQGLNVHVPGPAMCAWDWWSLGRVIQELVLGRHVVSLMKGEPATGGVAARARAEALLMETDQSGPRAGAVEIMPALDPQIGLLLRGLLTSASEARWTGDNIDRWVRGLPVKEHYATRRADTHFRWRGRPFTIAEAATLLQSAEHWSENSVQLFEVTTPGTLAHFLRWSPTQSTAYEQLTSAMELADALPLKLSSPVAQRETVTIIALLQISAGRLVWRGRGLESATIEAMFSELGETDGLMVLRALTTRSTALQIERIDAEAGRQLTELGRTTGDAEGVLRRHGWLAANDNAASARLFRLALQPIAALRSVREELGRQFAGSDHPGMAKLFGSTNPGRTELVVLAWAASSPERFKFFSHTEAARRRGEELRKRGLELIAALAWPQWESALRIGSVVFAGWVPFAITWFAAGVAVAILWPGAIGLAAAAVPFLVGLAVRMAAVPKQRRALRAVLPEATWNWRDGPARCRHYLRVAGRGASRAELENELSGVRTELAELNQLQPPPAPLPPLPRFAGIRLASALSWSLPIIFAGIGIWRFESHPPSLREQHAAWAPPAPETAKPALVAAMAKESEKSDADTKVSWPFKPGDSAVKAVVLSAEPATSTQSAYARSHGHELVAPYRPETINTLIIMPVPAGNDAAVMIYDGKNGDLAGDQLYRLEFAPIPRTWIEVSGRKGIYIDR